ncbi:unnamed protein product [Strongylus vulgaris]|uniref:SCP domain-containing protein n=1 Tax=Strongylus vulgaris TaxID=40348 RepID=A0A3P7IQ27_STRVU|nr:unnamed protein product [Strongylus vulgaris]
MFTFLVFAFIASTYADLCPYSTGMTDPVRNEILNVHNKFRHSDRSSRQNAGENIFMASPPGDKVLMARRAAYAWAGELNQYGVGKENIFTMSVANRRVGHYTQAVKAIFKLCHVYGVVAYYAQTPEAA